MVSVVTFHTIWDRSSHVTGSLWDEVTGGMVQLEKCWHISRSTSGVMNCFYAVILIDSFYVEVMYMNMRLLNMKIHYIQARLPI